MVSVSLFVGEGEYSFPFGYSIFRSAAGFSLNLLPPLALSL